MRDDVAHAEIIGEAVSLHLLRKDLRWRSEVVDRLEFLGQVPLALVGGVIARLAQHVADRRQIGRHAADPREIGVVEHPRLLDVSPGIEHRARRRAYARIDLMVLEDDSASREALMRRQPEVARQFAGPEIALLVVQNEQDVVGAVRIAPGTRARRMGRGPRFASRERVRSDRQRHRARSDRLQRVAAASVYRELPACQRREQWQERMNIVPNERGRRETSRCKRRPLR